MFWRDRMSRQLSSSPSVTPNELLEILLAHTYGYYVLPSEPYDEVFPNIYLGDSTTALCIHLLKRLGITHVLNAAWGRQRNLGLVNTSESFYRNSGIEFMGIEALDMTVFPLYPHFYSAANFIEQALQHPDGKILVHCGEGISRSSTLVIAYLMIKKGFNVKDAIRTVVKHRNILPNQGFLLQLCQLNDELFQRAGSLPPPSPRIVDVQPTKHIVMAEPVNHRISRQSSMYSDDNKTSTTNSGSSRSPTPNSSRLSSSSFSRPPSCSSRSPTPNSYFYPSWDFNRNNKSTSSLSTSSSSLTSPYNNYTSIKEMENKFTQNNNENNYKYEKMTRRTDFRRAQSCERRPNFITRGSGFLNNSSSGSNGKTRRSPSLTRSNYNHYGGGGVGVGTSVANNYHNHSLMTTYLVNRPLTAFSR